MLPENTMLQNPNAFEDLKFGYFQCRAEITPQSAAISA